MRGCTFLEEILGKALHILAYIFSFWIFSEVALGDSPKYWHILWLSLRPESGSESVHDSKFLVGKLIGNWLCAFQFFEIFSSGNELLFFMNLQVILFPSMFIFRILVEEKNFLEQPKNTNFKGLKILNWKDEKECKSFEQSFSSGTKRRKYFDMVICHWSFWGQIGGVKFSSDMSSRNFLDLAFS